MKVMKFGGTSVGSVESLLNVKAVVESQTEPVVVVVSALGGLTDNLIATAAAAARADRSYQESVNAIFDRHHRIIDAVVEPDRRDETLAAVNALLQELADTYDTIYARAREQGQAETDAPTMQLIVSFGERCSSLIVTAMLHGAVRFDSLEIIKTVPQFDRHVLDAAATDELIHKAFDPWKGKIAVAPGFISRDSATRAITNLGRGGSDYTAAIFAAALNADVLEIWTDVDGFMTADPRQIPEAYVIRRMTFVEAMELCNFGAKVVYPPTIYPVFHRNIPIVIKNTFNPEAPGTRILGLPEPSGEAAVTGISSIKATSQVTVTLPPGAEPASLSARCLNALARQGVTVYLPYAVPGSATVAMAVNDADAPRALRTLRAEFERELATGEVTAVELREGLATVAVVGCRLRSDSSLDSRLRDCLGAAGVEGLAWSAPGAADNSLAVVVPADSLVKAMSALHDEFFSATLADVAVAVPEGCDPAPLRALVDAAAPRTARTAHLRLHLVDSTALADAVVDLGGRATGSYPALLMAGKTVVTTAPLPDDAYLPLCELADSKGGRLVTVAEEMPPAITLALRAFAAAGDEITALAFPSRRRADEWMRALGRHMGRGACSRIAVETDPSLRPLGVAVASRRLAGDRLMLEARAAVAAEPQAPLQALVECLRAHA